MTGRDTKRCVLLTAFFALSVLVGCDLAATKVDDGPYLEALGFNKPIETSVYVWQPPGDDAKFPNNQNTLFLSALVASNDIAIVPNAGSAPWWGYGPLGGNYDGQNLTVALGIREATGRSEQRQWKEGPREFFAETITYIVKKAEYLNGLGAAQYGPFTLRLVLVNDPAVGHWQVATGQLDPQIEMRTIVLDIAASIKFSQLSEKISAARQAAFASIERALAASGTLERSTSDQFVLVSKKNRLAYYIKPNAFHTTTMNNLISYCGGIRTAERRTWRVPTVGEMRALMEWDARGAVGKLIDVPDGRLWGAIALPSPEAHAAYVASPWTRNESFSFIAGPPFEARATFVLNPEFFVPSFEASHSMRNEVTQNSKFLNWYEPHEHRQIYDRSQVNDIPFGNNSSDIRVVCVVNL